jgi:hypothetical protein
MKKGMKHELDGVLNMTVPDKVAEQLRQFGIKDEDMNNETAIAVALYQQAVKGNVNAINIVAKMTAPELIKQERNKNRSRSRFIRLEVERITNLFTNLTPEQKELARPLIENASFLSVTMQELREEITEKGIKEQYQNGMNQLGYKDSVEFKAYNSMLKSYMMIIKQLSDMMNPTQKDDEDEFDRFCDDI